MDEIVYPDAQVPPIIPLLFTPYSRHSYRLERRMGNGPRRTSSIRWRKQSSFHPSPDVYPIYQGAGNPRDASWSWQALEGQDTHGWDCQAGGGEQCLILSAILDSPITTFSSTTSTNSSSRKSSPEPVRGATATACSVAWCGNTLPVDITPTYLALATS